MSLPITNFQSHNSVLPVVKTLTHDPSEPVVCILAFMHDTLTITSTQGLSIQYLLYFRSETLVEMYSHCWMLFSASSTPVSRGLTGL